MTHFDSILDTLCALFFTVVDKLLNPPPPTFLLNIFLSDYSSAIRFVRRLLQFYKPSNKQYCLIEVGNTSARKLSEVGLELIDFLLRREEVMLIIV